MRELKRRLRAHLCEHTRIIRMRMPIRSEPPRRRTHLRYHLLHLPKRAQQRGMQRPSGKCLVLDNADAPSVGKPIDICPFLGFTQDHKA